MITAGRIERSVHQLGPKVSIIESNHISLSDAEQEGDWGTKVRLMRRDPTIALVRLLSVSGPLIAGWTVKSKKDAPSGAHEFIEEEMSPCVRFNLVKTAMFGCIDWGWQPFEKIFKIRSDGFTGIKKLKPLVQDETFIRVIKKSGKFDGFYQDNIDEYDEVFLHRRKSLLYNYDVEGTNWHGSAVMRNVESPYNRGEIISDTSDRYDSKIAGANWIIYYPIGTSDFEGDAEADNHHIAQVIESRLKASGTIIVPREVERWVEELEEQRKDEAWKIEFISATGTSGQALIDKSKYYDMLKVRGLGFPERSITEGQHGTKAEASEHGDFALFNVQMRNFEIALQTNLHLINQLLVENFGAGSENTVFVVPNELTDAKRRVLREMYMKLLTNPKLIEQEVTNVDFSAVREILDVPEGENAKEFEMPEEVSVQLQAVDTGLQPGMQSEQTSPQLTNINQSDQLTKVN